jgi:hypothetical protein
MSSIVNNLVQNKILLAILAGITSIGSFQVWKYNQEKHEKFIAEQTAKCQQRLDEGYSYMNNSMTLSTFFREPSLAVEELNKIEKPGINTPFKTGKTYVLMYKTPGRLLPSNPRYDGKFFENLSKQTTKGIIPPLAVIAESIEDKQATIVSFCTPESFTVSVENLYEPYQQNDAVLKLAPFLP